MSKRKSLKKCIFGLKLTSTFSELHSKYNIVLKTLNTTLLSEEPTEPIVFHDELRKQHKCFLSTVNFGKKYRCFWDHHTFDSQPIGCPIKYVPQMISRVYNSEITKDSFSVSESIPRCSKISTDGVSTTTSRESYETDGVFCSFNCALSFALSKKADPLYADSATLLNRIYIDTKTKSTLTPAPDPVRVLADYGGPYTIEEYRKNLTRLTYENYGVQRPVFKPVSFLLEEKYQL
jgi:hypothetical protein